MRSPLFGDLAVELNDRFRGGHFFEGQKSFFSAMATALRTAKG